MAADCATFLDEAAAARLLNVHRRTLQRWRASGDGPPFVRIGPRRVGYRLDAIAKWAEGRTFVSMAAEMARRAA